MFSTKQVLTFVVVAHLASGLNAQEQHGAPAQAKKSTTKSATLATPIPETEAAKEWRQFLVGDWHREISSTLDGKTTRSREDIICRASGNAIVSYAVSGEGYATVMAWDEILGGLRETGHGSGADWELLFKPGNSETAVGKNTGRLKDGRTGTGTTTVKRTSTNIFTAESTIKLSDGSIFRVTDKNTRK